MQVAAMVPVQLNEQMALALFLHAMSGSATEEEEGQKGLTIDLGTELLRNPLDSFATYARDESLADRGINEGDLLLVDKVLKPQHNDVVIITLDGELLCRILDMKQSQLTTCDDEQSPILLDEQVGLVIEGVVIQSVKAFR
ncbi:MAG: DNA polymerase V [Pseudomonadales bacterium]|nr:DNA polymerase V [Pseudomonadales bacterium]